MKRIVVASILAALAPAAAPAAIIADFELNGSLANSAGTAATLTNNSGTLGATGITLGANQGPTITGLGAHAAYTIDAQLRIDALNGARGNGYVKLFDLAALGADEGWYSLNGHLDYYPITNTSTSDFTAGGLVRVTVSRDAAGGLLGYINGTQVLSVSSPTSLTLANRLDVLADDTNTGQGESASGFLDYVRIYDTALTPAQALPAAGGGGAVPEPASWAMMVGGFGLVGGALRRRQVRTVRLA